MKKTLILFPAIAFFFLLVSCKKNWTCECKGLAFADSFQKHTTSTTVEISGTRRQAKKECNHLWEKSSGTLDCKLK